MRNYARVCIFLHGFRQSLEEINFSLKGRPTPVTDRSSRGGGWLQSHPGTCHPQSFETPNVTKDRQSLPFGACSQNGPPPWPRTVAIALFIPNLVGIMRILCQDLAGNWEIP